MKITEVGKGKAQAKKAAGDEVLQAVRASIKKDGELGKCWKCGAQTTKVAKVSDVPRDIEPTGVVEMPYCDAHFNEFVGRNTIHSKGLTAFIGIGGGNA